MIGRSNLSKGGGSADVVNGIIEQYLAENSTIDANTFVEFVNHYQDNTLVNIKGTSKDATATLIDTNKVFIAHQSDDINKYVNGTVCTISNNTITTDVDTTLVDSTVYNSSSTDYFSISVAKLDTNKILVIYAIGYNLYAIVCTVSGTTITKGTSLEIYSGTSYPSGYISSINVDTNKVFIAYQSLNDLYAIVCTVSGTTITKGTAVRIYGVAIATSLSLIDTNKVFMAYKNSNDNSSSGRYLYATVCSISGTSITKGSTKNFAVYLGIRGTTSVTKIDTNKVFLAYGRSNSYSDLNNYLYGVICTVNDTTITNGSHVTLNATLVDYQWVKIINIDTDKVLITHNLSSKLTGIICMVSGFAITKGTEITLVNSSGSEEHTSLLLISTNKIFISHQSDSTNDYLNGMIVYIDDMNILTVPDSRGIKPSVNKIHGLTKTSGTNISPADVWVLDNE